MSEKKDSSKDDMDEDPDFYIRTIAATWGHLDLIRDWLPHHRHEPEVVTQNVLIPAAMFGQLEVLKLAVNYGNVAMVDKSSEYPGWSLLHFAVEGAQRVMPVSSTDDPDNGSLSVQASQPTTQQQVYVTQLDIIYMLVKAGASPLAMDGRGHTASFMACHSLERKFLEGALLLDILSLEAVGGDRNRVTPSLVTPGLASIPSVEGWKDSMQVLMEWAYLQRHYEILHFCHVNKYVSLYSDKLQMKSNPNSLRESRRPLVLAALYEQDYNMIKLVMDLPDVKPNFLNKVYEYHHGQSVTKESILSYSCQKHFEGYMDTIGRLLALDTSNKFLASVNLTGVGLRHLPVDIMHPNLVSLNMKDNSLMDYPRNEESANNSLGWNCPNIESLNFSSNHLNYIHQDIFLWHPKLTHLTICNNEIKSVPESVWTAPSLKSLELTNNLIRDFPCPSKVLRNPAMNLSIFGRTIPRRRRAASVDREACLKGLRKGSVNYTMRSQHDTPMFVLETLDLTGNHLTSIPDGLPCLAPYLKILRLAKNRITSMGSVSNYPAHLLTLDLSNNGLTRGVDPPPVHIGSMLTCYQSLLDSDRREACSHTQHQFFPTLKYLDLCQNRIADFLIEYDNEDQTEQLTNTLSEFTLVRTPKIAAPAVVLFPNLHTLRISKNSLIQFPVNVHKLSALRELVVSQNEKITRIPPLLHKLNSLFLFKFDGISDPIVPDLLKLTTSTQVLYHLKARDMKCVTNSSMRLFVLGHHGNGKTTLLHNLKTTAASNGHFSILESLKRTTSDASSHSPIAETQSTSGIDCGQWKCTTRSKQSQVINFYTWDFAGKEEFYVAHQCFLTNKALYLLVWNILDGEAGVESLNIWLQNLHARAEGHSHTVIVVATHMDLIPKQDRERHMNICKDRFNRLYKYGQNVRGFPNVVALQFVGAKNKMGLDILCDVIHKTALTMDSVKDLTERPLRVKMLEEMVPEKYDELRHFVESYRGKVPFLPKNMFCDMVKNIIKEEEELQTAVEYLCTTSGTILHFDVPVIRDYYIVQPKVWFDLCSYIISPKNVIQLVRARRPGDEKFGLLSTDAINKEFVNKGFNEEVSKLVRTFLSQFNIIHPLNRDYYLIPSAISSEPVLLHNEIMGDFPRTQHYLHDNLGMPTLEHLPSIDPVACSVRPSNMTCVQCTGLIYRRMLFLPPIPSGFWSKLIALFLQKHDILEIVTNAFPGERPPSPVNLPHRLCAVIGNLELRWMFWKAGIVLYLGETIIMELHSLIGDEFERLSPETKSFQARERKLKKFRYLSSSGEWRSVPSLFNNVVELVIPEFFLVDGSHRSPVVPDGAPPVSSLLLVKALEIVDEVLKSHCELLAMSGIYTLNDMLHVIPCPLEYGDKDNRPSNNPMSPTVYGLKSFLESVNNEEDDVLYAQGSLRDEEEVRGRSQSNTSSKCPPPPADCICVFTMDYLIQTTMTADEATCPKCGGLDLEALAPDLVFVDISHFKLDKLQLDRPVDLGGQDAVAAGAFGTVFKRTLHTLDSGDLLVAVKVFDQAEESLGFLGHQEITRSYSDMRYELNKLSTLRHPYIVQFVGVFTNPHCFVLEWAPLQSLEHQRVLQNGAKVGMCYMSVLKVLYQVTSALSYLHFDVGIVHRDLKSSNILVFDFPAVGHYCFHGNQQQVCSVLVKITDMGICANPLGRKANSFAGLRLMAPECIAGESNKLTEKVDIFTLGSCLYEMMTLHHLPPRNVSQPEYKNMLVMGKRPQITPKDYIYPPILSLLLEECWQQDHFMRPSSLSICETAAYLLPPSQDGHQVQHHGENIQGAIFLDSFVLHPVNRVTACHCSNLEEVLFESCVALSDEGLGGLGHSNTMIAGIAYNKDTEKSELEIDPFDTLRNTSVVSIQVTSNSDIFVGCQDGSVFLYDVKGQKVSIGSDCSLSAEHGELVKVYYSSEALLMVVIYKNGAVHLRKCTQSITSSLTWRTSCERLRDIGRYVYDADCLFFPGSGGGSEHYLETSGNYSHEEPCLRRLEVWFGVDSDTIEVWTLSLSTDQVWMSDAMSKIRTITSVRITDPDLVGGECEVCLVRGSSDKSMVGAVIQMPAASGSGVSIGLFSVSSKQFLRSMKVNYTVCALLLTPSSLALGTYNGKVHVFDTQSLLSSTVRPPRVFHAHKNRIYDLHCMPCRISEDGYTSLFPTYIGRSLDDSERELIITIGSGRCYPSQDSRLFKKVEHQKGCFMNIWLL